MPVQVRVASVFGGVHTVEARINGVSVGSVAFAGRRGATVVGEIPASELRTIGNALSLELTTDAVEGSLFYVGHLDVFAPPRDLAPAEVALIEPYAPSLLPRRFKGVDYLVLTHSDFADQARRIARIKRGQGHRAAVVDVQEAYDQYTAGITDAAASTSSSRTWPGWARSVTCCSWGTTASTRCSAWGARARASCRPSMPGTGSSDASRRKSSMPTWTATWPRTWPSVAFP